RMAGSPGCSRVTSSTWKSWAATSTTCSARWRRTRVGSGRNSGGASCLRCWSAEPREAPGRMRRALEARVFDRDDRELAGPAGELGLELVIDPLPEHRPGQG